MQFITKLMDKANRTTIVVCLIIWILDFIWIFVQDISFLSIAVFVILTVLAVLYLIGRFYSRDLKQSVRYAHSDPITQHDNLLKFCSDTETLLRAYPNGRFVLFYSDIQNFKCINDVYGYEKGNLVLKHCSKFLE